MKLSTLGYPTNGSKTKTKERRKKKKKEDELKPAVSLAYPGIVERCVK